VAVELKISEFKAAYPHAPDFLHTQVHDAAAP